MSKQITVSADGQVISETVGQQNLTLSFAKKVGKPNYGNEEFFLSAQIAVDNLEDLDNVENQLRTVAAFVKSFVYTQLDVPFAMDEKTGVVVEAGAPVETVKAAAPQRAVAKPAARKAAASNNKDALWQELLDNPKAFFSNVEKKASGDYSPKSPDYKHKDSGQGLWLDAAPDFYKNATEVF